MNFGGIILWFAIETFGEGANVAYVSPWEETLKTLDPVPLSTEPSH